MNEGRCEALHPVPGVGTVGGWKRARGGALCPGASAESLLSPHPMWQNASLHPGPEPPHPGVPMLCLCRSGWGRGSEGLQALGPSKTVLELASRTCRSLRKLLGLSAPVSGALSLPLCAAASLQGTWPAWGRRSPWPPHKAEWVFLLQNYKP